MVAGTKQEENDAIEHVMDKLLVATGIVSHAQMELLNGEQARAKAVNKKMWEVGRETVQKFMPDGILAKVFTGTRENGSDVGDVMEMIKTMPPADILHLAHDLDTTAKLIEKVSEFAVNVALRKVAETEKQGGAQ